MSTHAVTLRLPFTLYNLFKTRAAKTARSVESELLEAVATAADDNTRLSDDLAAAVADLAVLDNDALRRAARSEELGGHLADPT